MSKIPTIFLACLFLQFPCWLNSQTQKELRGQAIEQISTVLSEPASPSAAQKIRSFENTTGIKLNFKVDEQSLDHLGGLSEYIFKIWQTVVSPVNTKALSITGEFSVWSDSAFQKDLSYQTYATSDLRGCRLPREKTEKLDSLYCKGLAGKLPLYAEVPQGLDGFFGQAAAAYQEILQANDNCPDASTFDPQDYLSHVNNTRQVRASDWLATVKSVEALIKSNFEQLENALPSSHTGTSAATTNHNMNTSASGGVHVINHNQCLNACQTEDLEVRCRMLHDQTGIRLLYVTATIGFYIPQDSLGVFRDEVTQSVFSAYSSKNIIVVLWIKMLDGTHAPGAFLRVRQNGDWLSAADIAFANRNNGGNYPEAALYKFLNIYKNIPKPLVLCYQVAKVNGLLTTAYFSKGDRVKGREQICYHSFKVDKGFEEIQQLHEKIQALRNDKVAGGAGFEVGGSNAFNSGAYEKIDELRNAQKIAYIRASKRPELMEVGFHVKEQYLLNKDLVHSAGLKYLKDHFNGIYPNNQMQQQMTVTTFPEDLAAGSCKYSGQKGVVEDLLNISSLLLSPAGLDFIPDALAVCWYAAADRTLDAFYASLSFVTPGLSCGMQKTLGNASDIINGANKGKRLLINAGAVKAVDDDINLVTSLFGLKPADVQPELVKLINDNPATTTQLLPVTSEQARIWSNTEKLEPAKRIELQTKLYHDADFRKKCLDDPDEVLRWGGVVKKVRGVTKSDFIASVPEFATDPQLGDRAWELFEAQEWKSLEDLVNARNINGGWPPNMGFVDIVQVELEVGTEIDRFGGNIINGNFQDFGTFTAPINTPFSDRALPAAAQNKPYKKYRVIKKIPGVKKGRAIPWFNQHGMGIQFQFPDNFGIEFLVKNGYLEVI